MDHATSLLLHGVDLECSSRRALRSTAVIRSLYANDEQMRSVCKQVIEQLREADVMHGGDKNVGDRLKSAPVAVWVAALYVSGDACLQILEKIAKFPFEDHSKIQINSN